jgi:hypothetical protein
LLYNPLSIGMIGKSKIVRIKYKNLLSLVACLIVGGCTSASSIQKAWQGHSIDELIESWGEPDESEQLGVDYNAYTWLSDTGDCRQTFYVPADRRILSVSNSGCDDS